MTVREQRVAEIRRLRDEGLNLHEIAERLGIAYSTAHGYYSDPDGVKDRARKAKTDGVCRDCGARTRSDGSYVPERCAACRPKHSRRLTREWTLRAIREWADENGGVPPAATDWSPQHARAQGREDKALRHEAEPGRWPSVKAVQENFGSWNAAIREAGFEPRAIGTYGRDGELPEVIEETAQLYRDGRSIKQVAEVLGMSERGVAYRLHRAGVQVRPACRRSPFTEQAA